MTTKKVLIEVEVPENWPADQIVGVDPCVLAVKHLGAFPSRLVPPARAVGDEVSVPRELLTAIVAEIDSFEARTGNKVKGEWPVQIRALLAAAPADGGKCQCSMRIRVLGDGCQYCNPELAAELAVDGDPEKQESDDE